MSYFVCREASHARFLRGGKGGFSAGGGGGGGCTFAEGLEDLRNAIRILQVVHGERALAPHRARDEVPRRAAAPQQGPLMAGVLGEESRRVAWAARTAPEV